MNTTKPGARDLHELRADAVSEGGLELSWPHVHLGTSTDRDTCSDQALSLSTVAEPASGHIQMRGRQYRAEYRGPRPGARRFAVPAFGLSAP